MSYGLADELRDLHQSIMACRTPEDLRSVQITIERLSAIAPPKPKPGSDLAKRLEDEGERLSGHSIDRGSVDAGIASNLAFEAAAGMLAAEAQLARQREALTHVVEKAKYPPVETIYAHRVVIDHVAELARSALGDHQAKEAEKVPGPPDGPRIPPQPFG